MSSDYENDIAKGVHRATDTEIRCYRCGYSGNNAMPQPDIIITTPTINYVVELKGPIQSEQCYVESDDIEQLLDCQTSYSVAGLAVKFPHREPVVVRYFDKLTGMQHPNADDYNEMSQVEKFATLTPDAYNPRVTDAGTLALDKPSTDDWPSAQAGSDDVDAILSGLGVTTDKSVDATDKMYQ